MTASLTRNAEDELELEQALTGLAPGPQANIPRSVALLEAAAGGGVAEAHRYLATLAGAGVGMPQSWAKAFEHLAVAAAAGSDHARGQLTALAAPDIAARAGIGGKDPGDRVWRALSESIRPQDWTAPGVKQVLRQSPRTVAIEEFLPRPVAAWLIDRARGRLARAAVFSQSDASPALSEARSNTAFEFPFVENDVVVLLVRMRIAASIGVPVAALEPSQVLHYNVGEAFALHHDYLDPNEPGFVADIQARGQRIVTFLIYLNDGYEGGETDFPALGLRHRGAAGDALYFGNIDPGGAPDPRTLHAGLPPTRGEKWLFSQWVRNRALI